MYICTLISKYNFHKRPKIYSFWDCFLKKERLSKILVSHDKNQKIGINKSKLWEKLKENLLKRLTTIFRFLKISETKKIIKSWDAIITSKI